MLGASLLLCNVVNRAIVRCTGVVCQYVVFILKTNIVIPTCTSDILPPVLPSLSSS